MIYQLSAKALPITDWNIFRFLPSHELGIGIWLAGTALLIVFLARMAYGRNPSRLTALLLPSLLYLGVFIFTYQVIDEVAMNLEHPYNLLHHGRFSMSRDAMVDGTVEAVFYLLHTPFAFTPALLIVGNFLICFVIGWLHLFALWKSKLFSGRSHGLMPLSLIASSFYLVGLVSNGFGNSLLSLVFMLALIAQVKERPIRALGLGALLPLIRPEGIVWAGLNALATVLCTREPLRLLKRPKFYLAALAPLAAAALYFGLYKIFYGHFLPTPMLFKATAIGKLENLNWQLASFGLDTLWKNYIVLKVLAVFVPAVVLVPLFFRRLKSRGDGFISKLFAGFYRRAAELFLRGQLHEFKVLAVYFALSACLMVGWLLTNFTYTNPIDRYYLIFFLCLTLLAVKILSVALSDAAVANALDFYAKGLAPHSQKLRYLAWAGIVLFLVFDIPQPGDIDVRNHWLYNRKNMAMAGMVTEKLLPPDLTLAASEMNTFGLMIDRPVEDFWGYSNRAIATARLCAENEIKAVRGLFLQTKPDVYFYHWFTEFPGDHTYANIEESFVQSRHSHANFKFSRLTDIGAIFQAYDAVILKFPDAQVAYLVARAKTPALLKSLRESGFALDKSRKVDPRPFRDEKLRPFHAC